MKLVDKLILKDLLPMFGVGIAMFATLWFAGGPLLEASKWIAGGIPLKIVLELVVLSVPLVLSLTFPMGMLLSVLLGYGRLSADSEAVALFAGGVPFIRAAAPAAALGVAASLIGFLMNDTLAAQATHRLNDLKVSALKDTAEISKPLTFDTHDGDKLLATVHIEKGFDVATRSLRQVTITVYDSTGRPSAMFQADSARPVGSLDSKEWELVGVDLIKLGELPQYSHHATLHSFEINSAIGRSPQDVAFLKEGADSLTFTQLRRQIALLKSNGSGDTDAIRDKEVGLWSKIALPASCLVFAMIGAPLGLRPQRSSKYTGWILAILIIFGYYVVYTGMSSIARSGLCAPALAVFLPDIIGLFAGAFLLRRASTI
ncbi:LPS export ABC transporter permease LptG [Capsulimonas corticalis]|uniref:LPS export ABC transporter permease LptG n=1 Tax=Capsulimonas corticalis TaxID=2219043 RepID=A0A402CYR9_9BACT|nr:LptF/LptG family permease [Capsulimonas corticalis]BDI31236.1 LPS export ABC transporter permease LptG [Capsulimonas corticalis]